MIELATKSIDTDIPAVPDFSRMPFRAPEPAQYRNECDAPLTVANNPFYMALPPGRTIPEVREVLEAGNPTFDPGVRLKSSAYREECIDDVGDAIFALRRHIDLEKMVMTTIRNSYRSRPWHRNYVADAVARAIQVGSTTSHAGTAPVGSGALFGSVGTGKTVSLKKILISCPQVIDHAEFRGAYIGVRQVAWLYVSMPPKASAYGLLAWIASTLDFLVGTAYRDEVDSAANMTLRTAVVAKALAIHSVGAIFIDELQNLSVGSNVERGMLENIIQELVNYTHTRLVFVGTQEARRAVTSAALVRRMVGERGQQSWAPMNFDEEWREFIKRLWAWQPTVTETALTEALIKHMHFLSGGVPDTAKRLYQTTMARIIGNSNFPDEQITEDALTNTMETKFTELHKRLMRGRSSPRQHC